MRYVCTSCQKECEIPLESAWPTSCECGGTSWRSPEPLTSFRNTGAFETPLIDTSRAAVALLRQPGSALDSLRNPGVFHTLT